MSSPRFIAHYSLPKTYIIGTCIGSCSNLFASSSSALGNTNTTRCSFNANSCWGCKQGANKRILCFHIILRPMWQNLSCLLELWSGVFAFTLSLLAVGYKHEPESIDAHLKVLSGSECLPAPFCILYTCAYCLLLSLAAVHFIHSIGRLCVLNSLMAHALGAMSLLSPLHSNSL
jgi:hypothetical protein